MYHIKADKRAYKSANLICYGLAEKLKRKSYEEISITDVCNVVGVSRATFYRLFDTLDDVLLYQFDDLFDQSIMNAKNNNHEKSYARMILELALGNRSLMTAIVKSGRYDIFDFSTRKKEDELVQSMGLKISKQDLLYCTPMLNQLIFSILGTWVSLGCKEDVEQLYEILKRELRIISENL